MTISDSDLEEESDNRDRVSPPPHRLNRSGSSALRKSPHSRCQQSQQLCRVSSSNSPFQAKVFFQDKDDNDDVIHRNKQKTYGNNGLSLVMMVILFLSSCLVRYLVELLTNTVLSSFREQVDW